MRLRKLLILLSVLFLMGLVSACGDDEKKDEKIVEFPPQLLVTDTTAEPPNTILIAIATLDESGWVIVQEDTGGAPGAVIGETLIERGENTNVLVTLNREATAGETMHATLHFDQGVEGTFESGIDPVLTDGEGADVTRSFTVSVNPPTVPLIEANAQEPDPVNEVEIDHVVKTDGPGWIAIREDNGGSPGDVIGSAFIPEGEDRDIDIMLTRDAVDGETLHAVIHVDDGEYGVFEYPGNDAEFMYNGGTIATTFFVGVEPPPFIPRLEVDAQVPSAPNQVTIREVDYDGAGWVSVFSSDDTDLGHVAVTSGVSNNLTVTLSRDVMDGETLTAELFNDGGEAGTYEAPDPDTSVTHPESGNRIRTDFVVSLSVADPAISATDQTLTDLTSVVTVASVTANAAGWVAVYEDSGGAPGALLGSTSIAVGGSTDLSITLSRPIAGGEMLWAQLRSDGANPGSFDGAEDPVVELNAAPVQSGFTISLDPSAVDVRINVSASTNTGYTVDSVEPAAFATGVSGGSGEDPALTLQTGWRYGIVNSASGSHPFELLTIGADETTDVVLLSQATTGSLEADADTAWYSNGDSVAFTVSSAVAAGLTGYRCSIHTAMMRGDITVQ